MKYTKREELAKLVKEMQDLADACDAKGTISAEEQEQFKRMASDAKAMKDAIKAEAEATDTLTDAKSFLASLGVGDGKADEQKSYEKQGAAMPKATTLGAAFVQSGAYDDFIKRYAGANGVIPVSAKGLTSMPMQTASLKAAIVAGGTADSAGNLVQPDRYPGITDLVPGRELTVRDLVTQGRTGSDTVEYVRVTAKTNAAAVVAEASGEPGGGVGSVGGYKPQSGFTMETVSTPVKTIAHWVAITKRAASDAGQVRTLVDNFLLTGLAEVEENQILNGDGVGENFAGINNVPGIQTLTPTGSDLDSIVTAIARVRAAGRRPNALVIHPDDWYSDGFLLSKNSAGEYLVGDPRASVDQLSNLWGLRVAVTPAQAVGRPLIGDFTQAVLWDREQASVTMTDSHADFFVRNLLAVLAEERLAFGVLDPQAFCKIVPPATV